MSTTRKASDGIQRHVATLLAREYGLGGTIERATGENDNFHVVASDGRRFVLKFAADDQSSSYLDLERRLVERVEGALPGVALPRVVATKAGAYEAMCPAGDGSNLRARLLEHVSGTPWFEAGAADRALIRELGSLLGKLGAALEGFDHPAAHRIHRWDLASAGQHREKVTLVENYGRRRALEWFFHLYAAVVAPRLASLPHSVIQGDVNDENVLVHEGRICGLLDFGDSVYNPTVCELAIGLAYALLDQADPLGAGAEIVAACHAVRPLSKEELRVLFPLVCARLAITVSVAADRRRIDPLRASWFVTETRAWALLQRLARFDPAQAGARLASGTGLEVFPVPGSPPAALIEKRRKHINPALSMSYREPIKMVRGEAQYLFDYRGRPFLDLVNNVCHVGHCHPRVVEAGQRQMALLNTNTRYLYDGLTEYAERLCATLPTPLDTCFLVNSGSEANELALRLATAHTGRGDMLVVAGAYHGHTARLIAISPYKFLGRGGRGQAEDWVHIVPIPDGYRGPFKGNGRDAGGAYGREVEKVISRVSAPIAGFIAESLPSCGGQVIPPDGYFEEAFRAVRASGGLCIIDEVQTGFGRAGSHFWAFERQGVVPDIVVMGKPIGNGHPMGAVVTTAEIAASFANGMEFFATFGGNPVSCAIGMAVLDVIRDEGLQQNALELGTRLREGLSRLGPKHSLIGDVRGTGLFLGVEMVRDRTSLEPATKEADELVNRMKARGILLSTDGPLHNVIKIKPPMVLTADDVDMVIRAFDDELSRI
jgi:4-aminobutyrate aminotransferase-like enzyme/Ser/Thr protein kinase RdoA (MazF antagonist)